MSEKSIEEKVKDIIVEQLGVNPEQVTPTASFIEDLGADSLDTVELVMAFEEEFGVEVPDEDAEKLQTVGDVVKYRRAQPEISQAAAALTEPFRPERASASGRFVFSRRHAVPQAHGSPQCAGASTLEIMPGLVVRPERESFTDTIGFTPARSLRFLEILKMATLSR